MVSILGANSVSGGYEVSNSLRFNDDDGPSLQRTPSSAGNRAVWTWSAWLKINPLGTLNLFTAGGWSAGQDGTGLALINGQFYSYWNTPSSPTISSALFRDPSAWYHVVLQANTSTLKVFVNGVEHSSKSISGDGAINNTNEMVMGRYSNTTGGNMDGYMTEINFVDGTAKAATDFGEYNDDNVWIPKKYTGSYGTNGFFLQFKQTGTSQNSSGIGADTSGQDNHFAVTNLAATDVTEDTCTNNFATFNPLFRSRFDNDGTFLEGNCQRDFTDNANRGYGMSTLGVTSGKWYWEIKVIGSDVSRIGIGVGYDGLSAFTDPFYDNNPSLGMHFYSSGSVSANGSTQSYGSSSNANDIFMYALDMDNHLIWLGKNGSWFNSATVTEIQNSTATNDITTKLSSQTFLNSGEPVFPMVNDLSTTGASQFQINFGNPPFSISSGNTDGKYGNFEYAPPSGYYALCTKRLAEFG